MKLKFTARKPKPRQAAVGALQETPQETAPEETVPESAEVAKAAQDAEAVKQPDKQADKQSGRPKELGGPSGPEPTRYGDWERKGICVDF